LTTVKNKFSKKISAIDKLSCSQLVLLTMRDWGENFGMDWSLVFHLNSSLPDVPMWIGVYWRPGVQPNKPFKYFWNFNSWGVDTHG
jgi:hypothetical protein